MNTEKVLLKEPESATVDDINLCHFFGVWSTIETVQEMPGDYKIALAEAASKDRNKIAIKKQLRAELNDLLKQLGNYVNTISNGDYTKLVSSGFNITKQPEPSIVAVPDAPVIIPDKNTGTLINKVKACKGARGYGTAICDIDSRGFIYLAILMLLSFGCVTHLYGYMLIGLLTMYFYLYSPNTFLRQSAISPRVQ